MNIQKKLYLVLTTIGIAIYGITLYSCNADEQIPNINVQTKDFSQYLYIENYLSKKVFNKAEKDILKEALYRVKRISCKTRTECTSAKQQKNLIYPMIYTEIYLQS